ncbi:MerR family DNA-binding protein [Bacteriovoracaceae bacterium]|nr:MerR family DNA-binding protein [Bacteriovoracaceae bacterium]
MNESLTIGKLADASQVNVETIRFYEKKGLLKKPTSKRGAFRVYPLDYITRIGFIKKAQILGFTLIEIKDLLLLDQNSTATCSHVSKKASLKLNEVQEKIDSLKRMEKSLENIIKACDVSPEMKACCRVSDCFESNCS